MDLSNLKIEWNGLEDKVFRLNDAPDFITGIDIPMSIGEKQEFTVNGYINTDLLAQLSGCPFGSSFTMTGGESRTVQIRRHKKKRINKKWAKRYGYKMIIDKFKIIDCSIVDRGNCIFEFIGDSIVRM